MYKITAVLKVETDIITCTESQRVRDTSNISYTVC